MRIEDLIVLKSSPYSFEIVDYIPGGVDVRVDIKNGLWYHPLNEAEKLLGVSNKHSIGGDYLEYGEIIGVYDRTNIQHLSSMIKAIRDLARESVLEEQAVEGFQERMVELSKRTHPGDISFPLD